ncbi:MAG TPA: hypothetical protein PKZ05_07805 [Bacteroidales bacterium]|mgnify:FL=1|nr:hypothetical protein [Bacteroidales bacterium]
MSIPKAFVYNIITVAIFLLFVMLSKGFGQTHDAKALFDEKVNQGEKFLFEKNYTEAKIAFEEARKILPQEQHPISRINEINKILGIVVEDNSEFQQQVRIADQYYQQQEFETALSAYMAANDLSPGDDHVTQRVLELNRLIYENQIKTAAYESAMKRGDQYINNRQHEKAKEEFEAALIYKPASAEAKRKLEEVSKILNTNILYDNTISEADDLYMNLDYEAAKITYSEALKIKPEESYPQNMIIRINEIILKIQTDEINLEESYVKAINNGDKYFVEKDFIQAKAFFEKALSLKSEEPYPQIKINEINKILETAEKTENDYRKAVAHADSLFDKTNWHEALDQYYKASELKPEEPYPHEKINAINLILFKNLDEEYQSAIQLGDELLSQNNLEQALDHFKKAVELKPDQVYPKTKIEEINEALKDLQQKKELYDQFISSADFQYDAANFHAAKASYRSALELFPESTYPKERITTIDGILKAEIERVQKEYNAAIAEADRFFMQKAYDNAINQYTIAAGIKPDEEYPLKRIYDITKIIEANVVVDVTKVAEVVQSNNLVRYEFNPVPRQGRRESYIILKTKNLSNNDFKLFLNYGKDGSNNGGFVISIPNLEQTRDYIVKVGSQYKWFSEDNNWVSLQPEGGNIKVELIQISQE